MWDKLKSESGQSTAEYVVLACIFVVIAAITVPILVEYLF